jgi:inner membrane transporter RhtA
VSATTIAPRRETSAAAVVVVALTGGVCGMALAASLIDSLGPFAVVSIRQIVAAAALSAFARPRLRGHDRLALRQAVQLGVTMGVMNNSVILAIDRLGVGPALTLEFLGPLVITLVSARALVDAVCGIAAAVGVVMLISEPVTFDPLGLGFGLLGAAALATYIVLNERVGRRFQRLEGTALAALASAVLFAPFGLLTLLGRDIAPRMIAPAILAGLLASTFPFAADTFALRHLSRAAYGVLVSVGPVLGALAGLVMLGQRLALAQWIGVALISAASCVAVVTARRHLRTGLEPTGL